MSAIKKINVDGGMGLFAAYELYAGGPGSGCNPAVGDCGRPRGAGADPNQYMRIARGHLELTMERAGTFKPKLKATPGHVGKCDMPTKNVYRYHAQVTATDDHLSPEGFIMDNARIQTFFDKGYNGLSEMSCEKMASFAARGLGDILQKEHISATGVTVQIGGSNGAWLTAVWKPSKKIHAAADEGFDFEDDDQSKKKFKEIHKYLDKAGYKHMGAGIYYHPNGTKVTVSYKLNKEKQ